MTALMPVRVGARSRRLGEARCVRERRGALSASSRRARSDGAGEQPHRSLRPGLVSSITVLAWLLIFCLHQEFAQSGGAAEVFVYRSGTLRLRVCYSVLIIAIGLNMQYRLSQPRPRSCESRAFNI